MRLITIFSALLPLTVLAQGLDVKETLEQVVVPEQQAAFRQSILPDFKPYQGQGAVISYTEYTYSSPITRSLAFSEPIPWSGSIQETPYRGYAHLGYFPSFNMEANLGYRLVSNRNTQVGLWAQYNGLKYSHNDEAKTTYKQNAFQGALTAVHHFSDRSTLKGDLNYTFANSALPFTLSDKMLGNNNLDLSLGWESELDAFGYFLRGHVGMFSFGADAADYFGNPYAFENDDAASAINQKRWQFAGGAFIPTSESSKLGIDLGADFLSNNHWNQMGMFKYIPTTPGTFEIVDVYGVLGSGSHTLGVLSANPYYSVTGNQFTARIGALIQGSIHCGKAFHIAPDVLVSWTPSQAFTVYGKVSGGEHLNPLSEMYQVSYGYLLPNLTYQTSHIPFTFTAGLNLGRWNGLSAGLEFNFAKANDWYMFDNPYYGLPNYPLPIPQTVDLSGYKARAHIGYDYSDILSFKASIELAPQNYTKGWYLWRDRAKMVSDLELTLRPIKALEIDVRYNYRAKRCYYQLSKETDGTIYYKDKINLGAWKDLSIGATYTLTDPSRDIALGSFTAPAISVFARIDNLLSKRPYLINNVYAQGFHGLVGVNVKF